MGSGYTLSNNFGWSKEKGEEVYNNYVNSFPLMKEYFDKVEKEACELGYIEIDKLTGAKYFIQGFEEFKALDTKFNFDNKEYWEKYRELKVLNNSEFKVEKEEMSKYFRWKGAIRRHALNLPVQGSCSNITKIAAIYTFNDIIKKGWFNKVKIVLFLHDEIMLETTKELADEANKVLYNNMIKAGSIYCKEVTLGASGGITEVWEH